MCHYLSICILPCCFKKWFDTHYQNPFYDRKKKQLGTISNIPDGQDSFNSGLYSSKVYLGDLIGFQTMSKKFEFLQKL